MDEAFLAYKKEVERSHRVILSMPIINDEMRNMHTHMQDMYRIWIDKLNDIETESTRVPEKKKRTRKPKAATRRSS